MKIEYKEKKLQHKLADWLSEWFDVRTEVYSDKKKRIDIIATCKTTGLSYGIEIKTLDSKRGEEVGRWIKQAHEYSTMLWPKPNGNGEVTYGPLPIFIYPRISYTILYRPETEKRLVVKGEEYYADRHTRTSEHHTVTGMLGVFNVGELRYINSREDVGFMFSNKVIWTNKKDYKTGKAIGTNVDNYNYIINKLSQQ